MSSRTTSCITFCSTPPRWSSSHFTSAWSSGSLPKTFGRRVVEERPDRLADPVEVVVVAVVGVGVVRRVPPDLLDVLAVVVAEQQVVAVTGRVERRRHHQRQEPVLDQVELVDDLRPEQAQRVGERRELEPGHQLLGDRRAADEVALLEDQGAQPRLGEVAGVDQAVVAAADDDRVVRRAGQLVAHGSSGVFLAGLKREASRSWCRAPSCCAWLMAISRCTSVPGAARLGSHPGDADVALQHRGVDEAGARSRPACRRPSSAVVQHRLVGQRVLALRRAAGRRRGRAGPSPPSRRRCRRSPSATSVQQLAPDRVASRRTARSPSRDAPQHPAQPELLGRDPVGVGEREPAVVPLDVDQRQPGLDAQHHQRLLAERPDAVAAAGVEHRVEHVERVVRRAPSARSRGHRCSRSGDSVTAVPSRPSPARGRSSRASRPPASGRTARRATAAPARRACRSRR